MKSVIERTYFFSLLAAIVLLPWSIRWCQYSLVVMGIAGLLSTSWKEKISQVKEHKEVYLFVILFGLYVIGLFYAADFMLGLKSIEQKLVLGIIPILMASSVSLTNQQRNQAQLFFVGSLTLLTFACIILNILAVTGNNQQVNFDTNTLSRFTELHPDANPIWMQFSYIAFGQPLIPTTTHYSLYLCFAVFILLHFHSNSRRTGYLKYTLTAIFCIVIILLSSRIAIFILFGIGAFNLLQKNFITKHKLVAGAFLILLCALLFTSPITHYRILEEPFSTPVQLEQEPAQWNSFNLRYLEWGSSIKGIKKNILLGTGTGGTNKVLNSYYDQANLGELDHNYSANNQFLEAYLEIGIAGFIVILLCFVVPIIVARKNKDMVLMSLILIMSIACLSNSMLEGSRGLTFFIVFVSLFMFTRKKYVSEVAQ